MVQRFSDKSEARGGEVVSEAPCGAVDPGTCPAPLFVGLPSQPSRPLIGRDTELAALRSRVCGGADAVLNGLPGVGKTALATALVHDPEVRAHFCGGVFWVGLGRTPNVESALGSWARALDLDLDRAQDASARAQELSVALQKRAQGAPVLLVVDDAWSWEDARPFREIDFPGCAHLVTTRDAEIARQFAGEATWVGELKPGRRPRRAPQQRRRCHARRRNTHADRPPGSDAFDPQRVWSAGCATGEEACSSAVRGERGRQGGAKILIAEDDPSSSEMLAEMLEMEHYTVEVAKTAFATVAALRERRFAAVLLDLTMPGMTHEELVAALRGLPAPSPLIVFSACPTMEIREIGSRLGAAAVLPKPSGMVQLLATLDRVTRRAT
jgi:CheY-like chemotaxis protein